MSAGHRPDVWAPYAGAVDVLVGDGADRRQIPLSPDPDDSGWWRGGPDLAHGERYAFSLDGGEPLPDPRSRWQPDGYAAPSAAVDPATFAWTDARWHGFHLPGGVVYELHICTFTPDGTFDAAVERLDHLVDLGVDAVEVMPIAEFPGSRGWGYDGVLLWAAHHAYGGPAGFARFVDACHERGLGVLLDVVYNHLGPLGNRLSEFGPYFTDAHSTPWGAAVNLDGPGSDEVRAFVVDNAAWWLRDLHVDGLRLDAVHALVDDSAVHILEELAVEVDALAAHLGRQLWVTAESERSDTRPVLPREAGGYGLAAQWADDLHHALHVAFTGERSGYFADYGSIADVALAWRDAHRFDRRWSPARRRTHGRPTGELDRHRFVVCSQNHDQVGNRAAGERLEHLAGLRAAEVAAAVVILAPETPLLFQGEEWAASSPFRYFVDVDDADLAEAIRTGRRDEFRAFGWRPEDVPDPLDPETYEASKLRWDEPEKDGSDHARMLAWYRTLLRLRRDRPALTDPRPRHLDVGWDEDGRWVALHRRDTAIVANLSPDRAADVALQGAPQLLATNDEAGVTVSAEAVHLAPLTVAVLATAARA